jgi:RsmE family RNA methyltransferase
MAQSHTLLVQDFDFKDRKQLSESELPTRVIRHLRALRIEKNEGLDFLNGRGEILCTRCVQTQPYLFETEDHKIEVEELPALHLYLSPPRKDTLGQALSQATEMGVRRISFLKSDHNDLASKDHEKTLERSQRILEASIEQCRAPFLIELTPRFLSLQDIPSQTPLFFADEDLSREKLLGLKDPTVILPKLALQNVQEWILLIGPEGGWSEKERSHLQNHPMSYSLGLGSRILKVPTACVAALYQLQIFRKALQKKSPT